MSKTNTELIAAFKKANKERRQKLVEKAGFKTAEEYINSLRTTAPPKKPNSKTKTKTLVDYVIAFDTTGSMSSYIADVKKHVEKVIPELFSSDSDVKVKIVAFGDYCDMVAYRNATKQNPFGDAYQQSNFTDNKEELIDFVKTAKNTGGGDEDEFYELVIKKIVEETPWREGSKRSVLFIADCNPHQPGYRYNGTTHQIDWREEAKKAASKGIAFDTMSIHGDRYPWYKELAKLTKGVYMPFQSSNKTAEVVMGTFYARSGDIKSKAKFKTSYETASFAGDSELVGVYKTLSSLID